MTTPSLEQERATLQAWLAAKIPEAEGLAIADLGEAKGGGWSARILFASVAYRAAGKDIGRELVVRFLPDYHLFLGTNLETQWRFRDATNPHSRIPAPGIIGAADDRAVLGQPCYLVRSP